MTLVERISRRMCARAAGLPLNPKEQRDPARTWIDVNWRAHADYARDALEEAMTPTPCMVSGLDELTYPVDHEEALDCWHAMVGAALGERVS